MFEIFNLPLTTDEQNQVRQKIRDESYMGGYSLTEDEIKSAIKDKMWLLFIVFHFWRLSF